MISGLILSVAMAFGILYFQLGEFFYTTFLDRIVGLAGVIRPLSRGITVGQGNPFANPSLYSLTFVGFAPSTLALYSAFGLVLILAVGLFVKTRAAGVVQAAIQSTLVAVIGYYLLYTPVTVQHYSWIVPLLIIYLASKGSNIAGALPTIFGFIVVLLGVSSTISFGYFVVGAPYIQIPALEFYHHHIVVFGIVIIGLLSVTVLPLVPKFRALSSGLATLYVIAIICAVWSLSYVLVPSWVV